MESGAEVFPTLFVAVVSPYFVGCVVSTCWDVVGCYGVILAMIGPRTTQEFLSHVQAVNSLFGCVYAVVGPRTVLEWG